MRLLLMMGGLLPLAAAFAAVPTAAAPSSSSSSSSSFATAAATVSSSGEAKQHGTPTHRGLERKTDFVILEEIPHDPSAFTQGLVYEPDGTFLEGTGLYGQSSLRRVNAKTGAPTLDVPLDRKYFGEGIVAVDDKIVQITWKERKALVYGRQNLTFLHDFIYSTSNNEGWGITTDGQRLIVSDGSANLMFWDKDSYKEIPNSRLRVEDGFGTAVTRLNELEYAYGFIWANIWLADDIVQIDPATGKVVAFYDFSALYPSKERTSIDQVLNGIAYDAAEDVFYLTGKWWPKYYKVKMCGLSKDAGKEGVCSVNSAGGK